MHFLFTIQITIRLYLARQLKMVKQRDSFNSHLKVKLNVYLLKTLFYAKKETTLRMLKDLRY